MSWSRLDTAVGPGPLGLGPQNHDTWHGGNTVPPSGSRDQTHTFLKNCIDIYRLVIFLRFEKKVVSIYMGGKYAPKTVGGWISGIA